MCPNFNATIHRQKGNFVVMAIFIIVVVGLLTAAIIKMTSASSSSSIQQVYGVRAELAAKSGIQKLLQASFLVDGTLASCNTNIISSSIFSTIEGLSTCIYTASCTSESVTYNSQNYISYKFEATGNCQIDQEQVVSRTISVDAFQEEN